MPLTGLGLGTRIKTLVEQGAVKYVHHKVDRARYDERISYPSYKSMDATSRWTLSSALSD